MNSATEAPGTRSPTRDRLLAWLLYLLPHHLLSQLMFWLTRNQWPPLKDAMIRTVVRLYQVDMGLAAEPDLRSYPSFNAFFTRALEPNARPLTNRHGTIACPVDGTVSEAGKIEESSILQAKGIHYSLEALLGGDEKLAASFNGGDFATIYLSPRDYHRIHMPLTGTLARMLHVPGRLFSVSPSSTRTIPGIFSRNERVISVFDTDAGPMAVIMVGAIFVSSMDTLWAGTVTPRSRCVSHWHYGGVPTAAPRLEIGTEMGRFNMGSTVILLFTRGAISWDRELQPGLEVHMGEEIGVVERN